MEARRGAASRDARNEGNARRGRAGAGGGGGMGGRRRARRVAQLGVRLRGGTARRPAAEEERRGESAEAGELRSGGNLHRSMGNGVGHARQSKGGWSTEMCCSGRRAMGSADGDAPAAARTRGNSRAGKQQRGPQKARMGAVAPRGKGLESACMRARSPARGVKPVGVW